MEKTRASVAILQPLDSASLSPVALFFFIGVVQFSCDGHDEGII